MSYQYSKGAQVIGDLKAADDAERNTQIDFGEDQIDLQTGGNVRFKISGSNGEITFNQAFTFPTADGSANQILKTDGSGQLSWSNESGGGGSPAGSDGQVQYNNGGAFGGTVGLFYDDSNNRVGIGTTSPDKALHIQDGSVLLQHNANNAFSNELIFTKSRNSTDGSHTVVQGGDVLGEIVFKGSDGDEFVGAAAIKVVADNTRTTAAGSDSAPGNNDMPGRIEFWTTKDGAANSTRQVTIDRLGNVFLLEGGLYVSGSGTGHGPLEASYAGSPYGGGLIDWSWGGATDVYRMRNISTGPAVGERGQWGILQRAKTNSTHADLNTLVLDQSGNMILGSTTIHSYSDKRRKENIRDIDSVLSKVKNLRPVLFSWKERWKNETRSNDVYGFIAQEVKELFPETIMEADFEEEIPGNEMYLSYVELVPILTKAIQEQQEQIDELKAQVAALQN